MSTLSADANPRESTINKSFCFDWSFLVNVPQYERNKGKPYLDDEYIIDSQESYLDFQKKAEFAKTAACQSFDYRISSTTTRQSNHCSSCCSGFFMACMQ